MTIRRMTARYFTSAALLSVFCLLGPTARADDPKPAAKNTEVPLNKVVLFNSGVGFFQREGSVEGDASLDLQFNVDDVNDLLKSMVLQDLGGGKIAAVNYASRDPITKTLKTFSIDLTGNPTLGQILGQARGEQVELESTEVIKGTLLGVETRERELGKDKEKIAVEYLNVLSDSGLRSVALDAVGRIRFTNEKLDSELRQALKVLALGHSTDKKTVSLNFLGQGKRPVRVGYIQATPVWKTSYRLVVSDSKEPFLQGWAIVENTTEEDWNKLNLTLVGGRPISFRMDLYEPLYVERPLITPELFASLRPRTYGQNLGDGAEMLGAQMGRGAGRAGSDASRESELLARRHMSESRAERSAPGVASQSGSLLQDGAKAKAYTNFDITQGGQAMAQALDVGETFQYVIDTPVTLPRQQSAMLPIVNQAVKGEKLSIYNEAVQAKHPLYGMKLVNATELHLMQGPITVFDDGAYAGDARIEDMQPGADRLISYAIDLDTEVASQAKPGPESIVEARIAKGVLTTRRKMARDKKYTIKNTGKKDKQLLIEYPITAGWHLTEPKKPTEQARDVYRFAVKAESKKPTTFTVAEETTVQQDVAVVNIDQNAVGFYLNQAGIGEKVKDALKDIVRRKTELGEVVAGRQRLEQQIVVINQEQERIRKNMEQLDHKSDLYLRYMKKFSQQEDQVESLRGDIQKRIDEETKLQKELDAFIMNLVIE